MSTAAPDAAGRVVGRPLPHESAALHVTGAALYTDDLTVRTHGILHAHPVQAPHAHARVTRLHTAPALEVPGVVRVLTAADVPGVNDGGVKHDEPLFPSEVMFLGHAVCWVLGETLESARLGALAVEVDYEPLPSIVTVREAIAADSFQGGRPRLERGDVDAAFAGAEHVFSGELDLAGQEHFYLETHCSVAHVDEGGHRRQAVRLELLAAEAPAHPQALRGDLVRGQAEHVRHDVLGLGRVLRAALHEHLPRLVDVSE